MEYNEVLEHFKKDIQNNPDIEIIQLKHGIMIFIGTRRNTHTLAFYCLLRLCCAYTQYGRFLFYCKGGDSDFLIPVITSGTYKIKNHSIPSWYVVSLLWWYAKRRYSNAPYRGTQKSR